MSDGWLRPDRVLTPEGFRSGVSVELRSGRIVALADDTLLPSDSEVMLLAGDLVPGFIDLQVNGGGGVLFNDVPTVEGIAAIAAAHRRFGTTGFLPTLISAEPETVANGICAVDDAIEQGVPGVLGIHIEGPFINPQRRGIHEQRHLRPLDDAGIELLCSGRRGRTLVTLAPELAPPGAIRKLRARGVRVAAGHTAASHAQVQAAIDDGLCGFTHLYNAMTPLGSREPGAVGAALDNAQCWCGVIVDGHHVHPASLRIAFAAKGERGLILVTDAMPPVGTPLAEFQLQGERITVEAGRCLSADGTLAGAVLDMAAAVRNAQRLLGVEQAVAVRMASANPARALGLEGESGCIAPGYQANLVLLDAAGQVQRTWIRGTMAIAQ
jgi:N-acetylglucosamine-6-phosphate deacetylase